MARKKNTGLRIGPISLLTLISVLLMAVLAMLCITTSNAASAMSKRQATGTTASYALESCGQEFLAQMDAVAHAAGGSGKEAVSTITAKLDDLKEQALEQAGADDLTFEANAKDSTVTFTVTASDGRTLNAAVTFSDDLTYSIDQWKITTTQSDETEENLWSGSATN